MCRLAAYLGAPVGLDRFLLAPPHSLIEQSWAPRETRSATLNADGFGIGWYDDGDRPAVYRQILPAWADPNLAALGRSLTRPLWLANVRSATSGFDTGYANTQPFRDDRLLFLHNGFVAEFAHQLRPRLRRELAPDLEADIHGTTDSEYLFALLRQRRREHPDRPLASLLADTAARVVEWGDECRALLNLVVSDGREVAALRHAIGDDCPSLYLTLEDPDFADGRLIASEPLTARERWEPVPPHQIVAMDPTGRIERTPL